MTIVKNIIDQHVDEASFKWSIRDGAITEPHYDLADLAELDLLLDAHLDGLRIAGDEGWQICLDGMSGGWPEETFVAAVLAYETLNRKRIEAVQAEVAEDEELQRAVISALGWIKFAVVEPEVRKMLSSDKSFLRYIGLGACAAHRQRPPVPLHELMVDEDPLVRARALKAAGECGRSDLISYLLPHFQEDDEKCLFYAAWSAALLGDDSALKVLKSFAVRLSSYSWPACHLMIRKMNVEDALSWLNDQSLEGEAENLQTVIQGYGALGLPEMIPRLIEVMSVPELARFAGESLSMITGVDLAYEDLDGEPPEDFDFGPSEDEDDDDVDLGLDDDLPWPNPELLGQWWTTQKNNYKTGTRYLCGKPISLENCSNLIQSGYQRQRIAAALEIALASPGHPLFEYRAPGFLQQPRKG